MYEHRSAPLLPRTQFLLRVISHVLIVVVIVGGSLIGGMIGYRVTAGMTWMDAFLNASMLLGGMGPVGNLPNDGAKLFAGLYALYAGVVFIASAGLLIAPVAHRIFHTLHLDGE
jgi:hypothetical protein